MMYPTRRSIKFINGLNFLKNDKMRAPVWLLCEISGNFININIYRWKNNRNIQHVFLINRVLIKIWLIIHIKIISSRSIRSIRSYLLIKI